MVVFNCRKTSTFNFIYKKQSVEICESYCYLGIVFTSNGSFKKCRKVLENKAQRCIFKMMSSIKLSYNTSINTYCKLFDSIVQPILPYGSEVWGFSFLNKKLLLSKDIEKFLYNYIIKYNNFNKVHMQFCRRILQVSNFCKQSSILMELGRLPLAINQIQRTIKFQFRC